MKVKSRNISSKNKGGVLVVGKVIIISSILAVLCSTGSIIFAIINAKNNVEMDIKENEYQDIKEVSEVESQYDIEVTENKNGNKDDIGEDVNNEDKPVDNVNSTEKQKDGYDVYDTYESRLEYIKTRQGLCPHEQGVPPNERGMKYAIALGYYYDKKVDTNYFNSWKSKLDSVWEEYREEGINSNLYIDGNGQAHYVSYVEFVNNNIKYERAKFITYYAWGALGITLDDIDRTRGDVGFLVLWDNFQVVWDVEQTDYRHPYSKKDISDRDKKKLDNMAMQMTNHIRNRENTYNNKCPND